MTSYENARWDKVSRIWEIIDRLRGDAGCPWDRKQTPETVQTYLIEEAHEAAAAVRSGLIQDAAEELGDLLFMVFFLIHLYDERKDFQLGEVCDQIIEKMIRRHPHVFGDTSVDSAEEVRDNWEKIKAGEKASSGKTSSSIPESLPALMRAYRLVSRLSQKEGGKWNDVETLADAFREKTRSLHARLKEKAPVSSEAFGEVFLELVNLARLRGYRAEDCLHDRLRGME
jgi:MazG family protein